MLNKMKTLLDIFFVSLKLGVTSFGGPVAHLSFFHNMYVKKRKWIDEETYTQLLAIGQFLPGPTSSQVGFSIGLMRGGLFGGIAAFIGFTLPSSVFLILAALLINQFELTDLTWIHGLKLVAVAIVAQAVLGMGANLAKTSFLKVIVLASFIVTLMWESNLAQLTVIIAAGIVGFLFYKAPAQSLTFNLTLSKKSGFISLAIFLVILVGLPILRQFSSNGSELLQVVDSFFRAGTFVFGGGHVVLPLLEQEFVATGWIDRDTFLTGYSITQAVPGPLFTFASYLGAVLGGWGMGIVATIAIFLPGLLLMLGVLPFWQTLQQFKWASRALGGVNAAVVGILLSAFYSPIWTSSILEAKDIAFAAILFSLLQFWKVAPIIVVALGLVIGIVFY